MPFNWNKGSGRTGEEEVGHWWGLYVGGDEWIIVSAKGKEQQRKRIAFYKSLVVFRHRTHDCVKRSVFPALLKCNTSNGLFQTVQSILVFKTFVYKKSFCLFVPYSEKQSHNNGCQSKFVRRLEGCHKQGSTNIYSSNSHCLGCLGLLLYMAGG